MAIWLTASWEAVAVLGFVGLVARDRRAWRAHPACQAAGALLLWVGMQPSLDAVARQSLWLHSLQSACIHHAAPMLLALACGRAAPRRGATVARRRASPLAATVLALAFAGMSGLWMLPSLHVRLMEDAQFYSAMKWGMALTGLLWCRVMVAFAGDPGIGPARYWAFSLGAAAPQVAVGIVLVVSLPLYPMICSASSVPVLDPVGDQRWSGVLMACSALASAMADGWRRHELRRDGVRPNSFLYSLPKWLEWEKPHR